LSGSSRRSSSPLSFLTVLITAAAGALGAYVAFIRPWHLRWGATDDEVSRTLLGDSLIENPRLQATHAITVHAPPEAIWPWLVQMGQGRGGFYSYEGIERLLGLRPGNANQIIPNLQELHAADELPLAPNGAGLPVDIVVPYRTLVMHSDSPIPARVAMMQAGYYRSDSDEHPCHPRAAGARCVHHGTPHVAGDQSARRARLGRAKAARSA
jgi:hypothetical protein